MNIILSPSKEMDFSKKQNGKLNINEITKSILEELKSKSKDELKKILKISDKLADEAYGYYNNFDDNDMFYAIDMYNGMAFKEIKIEASNDFAKEHIVILSAFYGCLNVDSLIKPYRLDFNSNLKVDGMSLKKLWSDYYNNYFKKGETILNLASDEFSSIIKRDNFNFIDFDFYEIKDGKEKRHSTISKKLRGKMADFIVKNEIRKIDDIKNFDVDGYKYVEEKSNDNLLVFCKEC